MDGLALYATWGGARFTARAAARVGELVLHYGRWHGRPLLDSALVAQMFYGAPDPTVPPEDSASAQAIGWLTNETGRWPGLPGDAIAGFGAGDQILLVVPSLQLVVVRFGDALADPDEEGTAEQSLQRHLIGPLAEALAAPPPYPASPVIREVRFAPADSIVYRAEGSDLWPVTWGDDDAIYMAYGDGRGFEPGTEHKLSLGFARVDGPPSAFRGENIRSPGFEPEGDRERGPKASGLLMVDGVLYLWVRNVANAQLFWSADHGRTWEAGFRFRTSFGSPTFLNFGRDYAGARDTFVYVFSQDGPSAYTSDDDLVLARVPRDRIRDLAAYQFFQGLDETGHPLWTGDIERRGSVFHYPGHVFRSDVVYDPGLRRYLLALAFNDAGGWGLFDAPEPWGPWTTAFATEDWGLGEVHSYRLPSKWITPSGEAVWLVFSGRSHDAFSVRRMNFLR